jgi:hypothetical protein
VLVWRHTASAAIHPVHGLIVILMWVLGIYNCLLAGGGMIPWYASGFSAIQFLGYLKSTVSFVKYVPQVYLNYSRKSTEGWAIGNTLLDVAGGIFSLAQMFVNAYDNGTTNADGSFSWDMHYVTGNLPKTVLAAETLFFDAIFIVQHYILYRRRDDAYDHMVDTGSGSSSDAGAGAAGMYVGFLDEDVSSINLHRSEPYAARA